MRGGGINAPQRNLTYGLTPAAAERKGRNKWPHPRPPLQGQRGVICFVTLKRVRYGGAWTNELINLQRSNVILNLRIGLTHRSFLLVPGVIWETPIVGND